VARAGDGLRSEERWPRHGGSATLESVIQPTKFSKLEFVPSSQGLEDIGRQITDVEGIRRSLRGILAL